MQGGKALKKKRDDYSDSFSFLSQEDLFGLYGLDDKAKYFDCCVSELRLRLAPQETSPLTFKINFPNNRWSRLGYKWQTLLFTTRSN